MSSPVVHVTGTHRATRAALAELAGALGLGGPEGLRVVRGDRPAALAGGAAHAGRTNAPSARGAWHAPILLSLISGTAAAEPLIRRGLIDLHNADPQADAFELLAHDGWLYLLATTPRGLLQAVCALREALDEAGGTLGADARAAGRYRIGHRFFHQRFMGGWPGSRADVRCLSLLGASHCLANHDWQHNRNLHAFVTSPIFPRAYDPAGVADNAAGLRRLIEDAADFGLEMALWITELPCQGGPWVPEPMRQQFLERFPAEVLSDTGTYQGLGLCFSHERVQAFYRDAIARFFAVYPEVGTLFLFNVDSGGEFCDPIKCPRCRGLSKMAQRDRLIRFLLEHGRKARPGLRVLTTGWGWDHEQAEFLRRQGDLPPDAGLYLAAQTDGWQAERQSHAPLRDARRICRERGQLFVGYDDLFWGDDAAHLLAAPRPARDIQDYPLGVAAKIRRWHELQADGLFEHWGTWFEDVPTNALACRAFLLEPWADPRQVCARIAQRQFGSAGARALQAWEALDRAHRVLSAATTWAPWQWPNWYQGRKLAPVPDQLRTFDPGQLIATAMRPKAATGFVYNAGDLATLARGVGEAWALAGPDLDDAAGLMRLAADEASDEPVGYAWWWQGEPPAPTRREHLQRQTIYLENARLLGREIGLHFGLLGRWFELKGDAEAYALAARDELAALARACQDLVLHIDRAAQAMPAGQPHTLSPWGPLYAAKAEAIEAHLRADGVRR